MNPISKAFRATPFFAAGAFLAAGARLAAGAFETVVVVLSTIVFGLGWAAFEAAGVDPAESGYDRWAAALPGPAAGAWEAGHARALRPLRNPALRDPVGRSQTETTETETTGTETTGDDSWIESAWSERVAARSRR